MKIRELDPNKVQYIIVHDLGKSEYSYGMRVIGKVIELRYNFDKEIESAIIESIPEHQYEITEDNNFELWKDYIANKTERVKR
ncbi:hypothetical protein I6G41_03295 [Staphylococcus equorum]|uniref:hypothetical protein n=1 Tax=Staphylococcus equorum TaxID=246432 RepID=UPI0018D60D9C|nr:hypothetical protein [Staphylococcus equorum]QPT00101.1 hypothetical protein I6G41_03295 [Staphylococcus equorum]